RTIPLNVEARNALIELRAIRELRGKGKAAAVLQGQRGPLTGKRTVKPVLPRLLSCWVGPLSPTQEPAHGTPQRSQARTRLAATPPTADLKRPLDPRVLRT
ncbi:MAG: hypothetical protein ABSG86_32315, partial [Thermoguttaceae bacterium]